MGGYSKKEKLQINVYNVIEERQHFHQDIELIYILEGNMDIMVGDQKTHMEPEDILVVNANKKHNFQASEDILFAQLLIAYELVSDIFQSVNIIFWCDSTRSDSESYSELRKAMKLLLSHYLSTQGGVQNFGHIALCYQVMDILSVHFLLQTSDKEMMDEKDKFENRLFQIDNYIRTNFNQQISLKELSEKLYLSNGYLSRFFKRNYGMSFAEYLTSIRLYHAVDELVYTSTPITRIAYDNGFASVAVFNKEFKKVNQETPSAFRKKFQKQKQHTETDKNKVLIEERLEQYLQVNYSKEKETYKAGRVQGEHSIKENRGVNYIWNKLINGGAAEDLLRSEVREHLMLLKEALGFEYVRFWNIFSKALLIDISREDGDYNFARLDSILDFLMKHGLKPHIELGQKPRRIHKSIQSLLVFEDSMVAFKTIDHWAQVIEALINHLVRRYGLKEIDTWKIEVWYDERYSDVEGATRDYFRLFNRTYGIIRKYSKKLAVGGCGIQTEYNINLNREFLRRWKEQEYQPDFLSVINYAYVRGEENLDKYSKRSTDSACLLHGIQYVKADMVAAGMANMKMYVTEWNLTISDRNYLNDTCFKGAYIVKNVLDILDEVEELGYFLGSDRVSEYYDTNALLQGGTGLMTKDGILKPAGFAFEFLNRLYPYYIGKGENYLITTDQNYSYGIICHNQKKLNYNYYFTKEDEIEKEHIWKYFENGDRLELYLKIKDVEEGVYQFKIYRINEQSGSILNIWKEMDYEKELTREDIKYFRRVCEPKLSIQKYKAENGVMEIDLEMEANEIAFVSINKII